jgi:hypothetical protein
MAKAKITDRGNVRVLMTTDQWNAIVSVLNHVRLGDRNLETSAVSDLMCDLSEFNDEYEFGSVSVGFTEDEDYPGDYTIELNSEEEDDEDEDWD